MTTFPAKKGVWMKAAQLEKRNGDYGRLEAILARAVQFCPQVKRGGGALVWVGVWGRGWGRWECDGRGALIHTTMSCYL